MKRLRMRGAPHGTSGYSGSSGRKRKPGTANPSSSLGAGDRQGDAFLPPPTRSVGSSSDVHGRTGAAVYAPSESANDSFTTTSDSDGDDSPSASPKRVGGDVIDASPWCSKCGEEMVRSTISVTTGPFRAGWYCVRCHDRRRYPSDLAGSPPPLADRVASADHVPAGAQSGSIPGGARPKGTPGRLRATPLADRAKSAVLFCAQELPPSRDGGPIEAEAESSPVHTSPPGETPGAHPMSQSGCQQQFVIGTTCRTGTAEAELETNANAAEIGLREALDSNGEPPLGKIGSYGSTAENMLGQETETDQVLSKDETIQLDGLCDVLWDLEQLLDTRTLSLGDRWVADRLRERLNGLLTSLMNAELRSAWGVKGNGASS